MSNTWGCYVRNTLGTFERLSHGVREHPVAVQQFYVHLEKCRDRLEQVYYRQCLRAKLHDAMLTEFITNVCLQCWIIKARLNLSTSENNDRCGTPMPLLLTALPQR